VHLLEFYWLDFASRDLWRLHFRGCVTAHESPFFGLLQGYSQNCALIANCRSRQTDPFIRHVLLDISRADLDRALFASWTRGSLC